jgi:hypothetical protein
MKKTFKIISSNPNKTGGFVTKLYCETLKETVFGIKALRETYYVSGSKQMVKDDTIKLDLTDWRVASYPFERVDETTGEISKLDLKWLHLKDETPSVEEVRAGKALA